MTPEPRFLRSLDLPAFLRRRWPLLLLLTLSLVLRILLFQSVIPRIHTDTVTYLGLRDLDPVRTPGYPLFIELIQFLNDLFSITPRYLLYTVFFQMFLLGMVNCYLIYTFSRMLTRSDGFALAMGILYNLDYFVIGFEFLILTETLSLTLLGLTLLFYQRIFKGKKAAPFLAGGLSVCLLLTRPSFAALFILLAGLTVLAHRQAVRREGFLRKYASPLAIFLVINVAGIGSWSLRNKVVNGFFGISSILPYQLGYFTEQFYEKYRAGSDPELDKLAMILIEERGRPFDFRWRLVEDLKMPEAEIARVLLRLNLKLIRANPGDYLKLLPRAARHYYRYSWDWTGPQNKRIFSRNRLLAGIWRFFFDLYSGIARNKPVLVLFVLIVPLALLVAARKERDLFHLLLLIEGTIHSNFIISIFFTPGGINNLRYRAPVEPFILLVFYAAVYFAGRALLKRRV